MRKDPAGRIHSIADVGIDLEDAGAEGGQAAGASAPAPRRWPHIVLSGVVGAALAATALLTSGAPRADDQTQTVRFNIAMPDGWTLAGVNTIGRPGYAISPNGQKLAVVLTKSGESRVFIRRLDETAFRELSGTRGAQSVFWAPDSERLGFALQGTVFRKTDLGGTVSQQMAAIPGANVAIWGPDDQILIGQRRGPLLRWSPAIPVRRPVGQQPTGVVGQSSLGAVESTMERRAANSGQEHLPPSLLRLSVGIECWEDLRVDLEQALEAAAP